MKLPLLLAAMTLLLGLLAGAAQAASCFDAYATRGIHLDRTQTLAGGANHCNFRFSRLPSD